MKRFVIAPLATAMTLAVFCFSARYWSVLVEALEPIAATETELAPLRSLLVTLGGALTSAAAIVSSLVLFSMQANIERIPHGLFRRLSSDFRLLGAFALTFLLSIILAALSLFMSSEQAAVVVVASVCICSAILGLFLYSYRRALFLVNPAQQILMVVRQSRRDLRAWGKRAEWAVPLMSAEYRRAVAIETDKVDAPRAVFFNANPHWTAGAVQGLRYAEALVRGYAERGDHEVSRAALDAIVAINKAYIDVKRKTFFSNSLMSHDSLATDQFINTTLESMRQTIQIALSRGDERQAEQVLESLAQLVELYLSIDYASEHASKSHAHLAGGYLSSAVEKILPHRMPDVVMQGTRLMGRCAKLHLAAEGPNAISTLVEKIGVISRMGVERQEYRPVTLVGLEQLADISVGLLKTDAGDVRYASEDLRKAVSFVAKPLLNIPDIPLFGVHSNNLSPYYSSRSMRGFVSQLTNIVSAVSGADGANPQAKKIISNLVQWSEGLHSSEKDLFVTSIEKQSNFVLDMTQWIEDVALNLTAASLAPACSAGDKEKLQSHAYRLIAVLTWVPNDLEAVTHAEQYRITESFFEIAMQIHDCGCSELFEKVKQLFIQWAFKAGVYQTGFPILERCIYGLAVLAAIGGEETVEKLKLDVAKRVARGGLPDRDLRDGAAIEIRGRAASPNAEAHWGSPIEMGLQQSDQEVLRPLLEDLANIISPETEGQASEDHFF
ncbi:hypothetical protein [Martelella sp. AD-3]|uniref:hypothetical protein n=1 Tax=Martelella sp. AD-3 TaxID=686597 RepID=UPI000465B8C0|nr:hypothetical protein [Martelella sp. AD-3]AMM84123.1 hypothetical protein AZF01_06935 [Martelella sp. AD-3]